MNNRPRVVRTKIPGGNSVHFPAGCELPQEEFMRRLDVLIRRYVPAAAVDKFRAEIGVVYRETIEPPHPKFIPKE